MGHQNSVRSFLEGSVALLGVVFSMPAWILIGAAIAIEDGRPVLFKQKRIGLYGRPFTLLKFRSMKTARPGTPITSSGDSRVTRIGRFIRKFKLDEIPQLWNVVRGEMEFVGPRPEIPLYVNTKDPVWQTVLSVRPGITDLATLFYRNEEAILGRAAEPEKYYRDTVLPNKLRLNMEYLKRRTLSSDLRLLALTLQSSLMPSSLDQTRLLESFLDGGHLD
jgi:lipopolysaccharide/colanic/teichoic acid biosynthesis glycosyltransferase